VRWKKIAKILEKKNYYLANQKGSHLTFRDPNNPDQNTNFVTIIQRPEIPPPIVNKIIKQMGISREEFFKLLEEV
jgi:predicted RNA binding protein YcfA (HicA-like mRNA interferase family)